LEEAETKLWFLNSREGVIFTFSRISMLAFSDQFSASFMSSIPLSVDMGHELEQATSLHQLK